jgi:hypothetical protein
MLAELFPTPIEEEKGVKNVKKQRGSIKVF